MARGVYDEYKDIRIIDIYLEYKNYIFVDALL